MSVWDRRELGLTGGVQLGELLAAAERTVYRWLRGQCVPTMAAVRNMERMFRSEESREAFLLAYHEVSWGEK